METITELSLDLYISTALAVFCLFCGIIIKRRWQLLDNWCIPSPFIGGLFFSVITLVFYLASGIKIIFDNCIGDLAMTAFFSAIGFRVDFTVLKHIALSLILFSCSIVLLIVIQNGIGMSLAIFFNLSALEGLNLGSLPLAGGDSWTEYFKQVFIDFRIGNSENLISGASVFGMICGTLLGSMLAKIEISKFRLKGDEVKHSSQSDAYVNTEHKFIASQRMLATLQSSMASGYANATYKLLVSMGCGAVIKHLLAYADLEIPIYIAAMLFACVWCNLSKSKKSADIHSIELNNISNLCLSLYLAFAFMKLSLWDLAALTPQMYVILIVQVLVTLSVIFLLVFWQLGHNYDAAVLSAGALGFGLGALSSGVACMMMVTGKYGPSIKAYLLIPIVGSLITAPVNRWIISYCINLF